MIIPFEQLDKDTLYNLIESYVLREGTDYGEQEFSIESKVAQVNQQLKSGEAMVFFSELHESVTIISKSEFKALQSEAQLDE
ncbi:YheU family protein [Pseudoalteromonas sp. Scap03]|uniref:YheU family protein n=1 Tax=unclassified Pseudoalteromonas TaxID=194690 RepID=UPI0015C01549|nr:MULTISPECIES: YheU family protein [unclassified Pseudoalteromonas]NWL14761.1 YheU family protein [Pseudoalteromonas sp. Scap03]QLE82762.1 YheU family protein [Pseudoalteromonas sp. Scap25]QLE90705.1 YheU family protein [Pseudoalteromonas sp. Scap06]